MTSLTLLIWRSLFGLLVTTTVVAAENWTPLRSTPRFDLYYDPGSMSRSKDIASLVYLSDLKMKHVYASAVTQAEFDCGKRLMRILSVREYSENMGRGNFNQAVAKPLSWDKVAEKTVSEILLLAACSTPHAEMGTSPERSSTSASRMVSSASQHSKAFDPVAQRNSQLLSLFNMREAASSVSIEYRFFEPLKSGESYDGIVARMSGKTPTEASLQHGGRVYKNLEMLLSKKLAERFSIQPTDWKSAPYRFPLSIQIIQSQDLYGANMFEALVSLDVQEFSTSNTGLMGFMTVSTFRGQSFAKTKEGVEGMAYEALDKALDALARELKIAQDHCKVTSCRISSSSVRTYTNR